MILAIFIHGQKLGNFLLTKRSVNHFTGRNNPEQNYNMNGHILEGVPMQKDLGIIVDKELKFHEQTAAAVKKANQVLGIIKKTIYTKKRLQFPYCICHW